jgi:PadR family transcriptional regulator, regulatory protein AphA
MRREAVGRRSRAIYEITPAGRDALRRQLATPPAPPQLEFDALQRLIHADQGSKHDLLATLDSTSEQVQQLLEDGLRQVRGYQADGGPFPERLHLIMLFARFYVDFLLLVRDWIDVVRREAASWPSTRDLGLTDGTRQMLEDLLRLADQLTPEQAVTGRTQDLPASQQHRERGRIAQARHQVRR